MRVCPVGHYDRSMNKNVVNSGYEIRMKDNLSPHWYEWFDGWTITNLENGEVLLSRSNVDQSALHGTLNKIRDLNLILLSVSQLPDIDPREEKV